ncbi:MAG: exodeoxyribonuclease VII large subunit, partial [candidate division Zixibacteria bacterium]|nr:exodeoxyribonuclease VII large subunit [candidate division Zixibacteria bacterium]
EESFPSVWVEGEISNYILHSSGHRYLSLKDENAIIRLTIWRHVGQYLKFEPENGMKVWAFGDITVYEKGGSYQLNVKKLMPVGVGPLEIAFRQLYERLSKEGLFDEASKRPLPEYPTKVGLVTSPTGAAIRDFIQIAYRRNNTIQLVLYPAQIQGAGAESSIIAGIKYFNERDDIDLIMIGRGGGSLEDLWTFNEEALVRAIVSSKKTIVTGIGHEIDTTLSDLAADLRAPTPSSAAELIIWDKKSFLMNITGYLHQLRRRLLEMINKNHYSLNQLITRPVYVRPETFVREQEQYLDIVKRQLIMAGKIVLEKQKNSLSLKLSRLESLSPLAILNRGYAVIKSFPSGKPVKSITALKREDLVETILKDGSALAAIKEIRKS